LWQCYSTDPCDRRAVVSAVRQLLAKQIKTFTLRTEFFVDPQGQRTGVITNYVDAAVGWQHWFSPQIEVRPEIVR
jgi:hypothetical protein